jgi:hypothetical protein
LAIRVAGLDFLQIRQPTEENKKSPLCTWQKKGFFDGSESWKPTKLLFLGGRPFGSFEGVDFNFRDNEFRFHVGGEVADPQLPFGFGIDIGTAVAGGCQLDDALTAPAFLSDGLEFPRGVHFSIDCLSGSGSGFSHGRNLLVKLLLVFLWLGRLNGAARLFL